MKVAIAGYAIEGRANLKYWLDQGCEMTILDEKSVQDVPEGVAVVTGPDAFSALEQYDLVVRTASLRPSRLASAAAITSSTIEFFDKCPAPIIGVTGTKGKGTTSSLIAAILKASGKNVHLVGNIGTSALEALPSIKATDIVVYEMSSFQLWDLTKSPHIAVVLMIEPDHLDVHMNFDEYVAAKANITLHQLPGDTAVFYERNEHSRFIGHASPGLQVAYPEHDSTYIENDSFWYDGQKICPISVMQIPGKHNLDNACAAIAATWKLLDGDTKAIRNGLENFMGLPHRLKLINEKNGVRYYDDNYSSAPGAAIAALRSFTAPEILIFGGYDKKTTFHELARAAAAQKNIKKIVLMGQTRHAIARALDDAGVQDRYVVSDETTLEPIVELARSFADPGDVLVMSPGCASFDMFVNFSDRGDQFIRIVEAL